MVTSFFFVMMAMSCSSTRNASASEVQLRFAMIRQGPSPGMFPYFRFTCARRIDASAGRTGSSSVQHLGCLPHGAAPAFRPFRTRSG